MGHANKLAVFPWEGEARRELIPSLSLPSDHYSVLTDFVLPVGLATDWAHPAADNTVYTPPCSVIGSPSRYIPCPVV